MVIDVELEQANWELRDEIQNLCHTLLMAGTKLKGTFVLKRTHMKGFRIVFRDEEQCRDFIFMNNSPVGTMIEPTQTKLHSKSRYASIYFVDWPIDKIEKVPKIEE